MTRDELIEKMAVAGYERLTGGTWDYAIENERVQFRDAAQAVLDVAQENAKVYVPLVDTGKTYETAISFDSGLWVELPASGSHGDVGGFEHQARHRVAPENATITFPRTAFDDFMVETVHRNLLTPDLGDILNSLLMREIH